jgi:hypothetical protein
MYYFSAEDWGPKTASIHLQRSRSLLHNQVVILPFSNGIGSEAGPW